MEIEKKENIEIEILSIDNEHIKFLIKNIDAAYANSLRRIMIAEIPTMAIELVYVEENRSVLPDEMLAHRLGLIPLDSTNVDNYNWRQDCNCDCMMIKNCPKCSVTF